MLVSVLFKSLRSACSPLLAKLFALCVLGTSFALALFITLVIWGLLSFDISGIDWLNNVIGFFGSLSSVIIAYLLFPALLPAIGGMLCEYLAVDIEAKEYPEIPTPAPQPFWSSMFYDLRFLALSLSINILILPILLIPLFGMFVFYCTNAYLLGREFFSMVASRHIGKKQSNELRRAHRLNVFLGGLLIAVLVYVPIVNLVAPFFAIIFMLHLYHSMPKMQVNTQEQP